MESTPKFEDNESIDSKIEEKLSSLREKLDTVLREGEPSQDSLLSEEMKLSGNISTLEDYNNFKQEPFWSSVIERVNSDLEDPVFLSMLSATVVGSGSFQASGLDLQTGVTNGLAAAVIGGAIGYLCKVYDSYREEDNRR